MSLHKDTSLSGGLDYSCSGTGCRIIHSGPETLNLGSSTLEISGPVELTLQDIRANSLLIEVTKGDIMIMHGILQMASIISTDEGDVLFQSSEKYQMQYAVDSNNVCMSAPSVSIISRTDCALSTDSEADIETYSDTVQCSGTNVLCADADSSLCTQDGVIIIAKANGGNLYANLIPEPQGFVLDTYQQFKGYVYQGDDSIAFDPLLNHLINEVQPKFNDTSKTDSLLLFNLGALESRATSSFKFAATTNSAYLDASPW